MKRYTSAFALGLVLMSGALLTINGKAGAAEETVPGKKDFESKCMACHAKNGKGNPAMAKALKAAPPALDLTKKEIAELKDADLAAIISKGKNKMAGFEKKMKPEEIQAVVKYIRTLASPAPVSAPAK